jgi:GT2 family glycosyltransferase
MDLCIVIVSWNTREMLQKCLASIEAHKGQLAVQTVVVDNDSADGTCEMVTQCFPGVRVVQSGGNLGFARGCNLGLGYAEAPLVLFLNPDTEILADALTEIVDFMATNPAVGAMNCLFREPTGEPFGPGLQWFPSPLTELAVLLLVSRHTAGKLARLFPYQVPEVSGYVRKLYGGCLAVRKKVLASTGAFDERFFMYCEDVDLSRRILEAGWKLYYLSEAEILHLGGGASSRVPGRFSVLMMCESFSKLMRKHHGPLGSIGYRAVALFGSLFRVCLLLVLRLLALLGLRANQPEWASSLRKYGTIIQWALGLQKAFIPKSRGTISSPPQECVAAAVVPSKTPTDGQIPTSGASHVEAA